MRPSDSPDQDAAAAAEHQRAQFAHSALENLFDVSPDAIFVTDAEGVIRGANPRAAELVWLHAGGAFRAADREPCSGTLPRAHPAHRENYNAHPRARQMGAAMNLFRAAQGWHANFQSTSC